MYVYLQKSYPHNNQQKQDQYYNSLFLIVYEFKSFAKEFFP